MNNELTKTANTFAEELDLNIADVDPDGNKLIIKWKSILSLQKKITNLEDKILSLEEDLAKSVNSNGKSAANVKVEDLYIPKVPAKF